MTKIQLRRDTLVNFTSKNPILAEGELAYETDTKKLKIGDGTTAYTQLEYFSAGGGTADITASLPLKIVDGVISLEVDGQTIQIVDGKLHANLDELGNEVNSLTGEITDLSGRVTAVEADILSKQDKLTTASPLDIKNVASVSLRDVTISGDNLSFGNNNLLKGQVGNSISTSSTFAQSIQTGIVIPYKFGQVLQFHCGNDTYVQGSNIRHGSPCVALFGHFSGSGDFVTALAINGFASYISSSIRGNMGGALKGGAVSMLPNTRYQTTSGEQSVERGENTINMGSDYSTYIQLMVNDEGNLMQGIYGHYGTNSTNVGWGAMARTDVIQDRSLDSGQTVADIIAAIDTAVIIKGSNFGTIKKANFGLYDYNQRLPWTQSGYDTFMANKGNNLIDLDNPSIKPQLQLNIGDGLSVTNGKLTTAGGGDVTAAGDNTFTGANTFDKMVLPSDLDGVKGISLAGDGNASIYNAGNYLVLRKVNTITGGGGNLVLGDATIPTILRGSVVKTETNGKIYLTQGNVTAGDNVTITDTTDGIQISATGGGSSANIPLVFGMSQYYKGEMNNVSWLKSEGQQNTKALYPDFYAWVLEKANAGIDGFKLSTATDITDYDFVINTTNETFRLPLKNGQENLPDYSDNQVSLPTPFPKPYVAPSDGYLVGGLTAGLANTTLSINGRPAGITNKGNDNFQGSVVVNIAVKKGDVITIDDYFRDELYFIPLQGNGNLYYYCGNTTQDETLINVGEITDALTGKLDIDLSNISATGKSRVGDFALPSNKYIDLTLGQSGSTYTAPANGWLVLAKIASASGEYVQFSAIDSTLGDRNNFITTSAAPAANYACDCFMPIKKGQSTTINYHATGNLLAFRFVYAEGEQ